MIQFNQYSVSEVSKEDALGIHLLMTNNSDRFIRFFPKTLEANTILDTAKVFASKKEIEFNSKEEFLFTVKEKNTCIGLVYIKELDWKKRQGEFAYCLDKEHNGKGLMTKIVGKLIKYAFKNLGFEVFQIIVHKDNLASVKVAENTGFKWQRTLLKKFAPPNEPPLDMELYELEKSNDNYHV